MKTRLILAVIFGVIGLFIGSGVGIAAGGDAYNGGLFFAFIGAVFGFLIGGRQNRFWNKEKSSRGVNKTEQQKKPEQRKPTERVDTAKIKAEAKAEIKHAARSAADSADQLIGKGIAAVLKRIKK